MRTAHLLTIHDSVATRCQGRCPQVNKFEQVSSDSHQMPLAGGWAGGPMSEGILGGGSL